MNSQEMETAVRLGLNLTVLILRDDAYGMIRWKQANMQFKDWGLTYETQTTLSMLRVTEHMGTGSRAPITLKRFWPIAEIHLEFI